MDSPPPVCYVGVSLPSHQALLPSRGNHGGNPPDATYRALTGAWPAALPQHLQAKPTPRHPSSRQARRSRRARGGLLAAARPLPAPGPPPRGRAAAAGPRTPPALPGGRADGRLPAPSRSRSPSPCPGAAGLRATCSPHRWRPATPPTAPLLPAPASAPALCARQPPPGAGAAAAAAARPRTMPLRGRPAALLPLCLLCLQAALPLRGHRGRYAG